MINESSASVAPLSADEANNTIDLELGKKLKLLRVQAGLTQSNIAEFLEISPQQYQKYEKGASRCSISTIYRLAEYYDLHVNALLPSVGRNAQGFAEDQSGFSPSADKIEITDEADAMAQLLAIFIRIKSKPSRLKVLQLLTDTIDPTS